MQDLAELYIQGQAQLGIVLTPRELAKELKINYEHALALTKQDDFPAVRLGERKVVVPRKDLIEWLSEKAKKGA